MKMLPLIDGAGYKLFNTKMFSLTDGARNKLFGTKMLPHLLYGDGVILHQFTFPSGKICPDSLSSVIVL